MGTYILYGIWIRHPDPRRRIRVSPLFRGFVLNAASRASFLLKLLQQLVVPYAVSVVHASPWWQLQTRYRTYLPRVKVLGVRKFKQSLNAHDQSVHSLRTRHAPTHSHCAHEGTTHIHYVYTTYKLIYEMVGSYFYGTGTTYTIRKEAFRVARAGAAPFWTNWNRNRDMAAAPAPDHA